MLVGRLHGPMTFRFIMQPLAASFLAVRAGLKDARERRPPFLWSALLHSLGAVSESPRRGLPFLCEQAKCNILGETARKIFRL